MNQKSVLVRIIRYFMVGLVQWLPRFNAEGRQCVGCVGCVDSRSRNRQILNAKMVLNRTSGRGRARRFEAPPDCLSLLPISQLHTQSWEMTKALDRMQRRGTTVRFPLHHVLHNYRLIGLGHDYDDDQKLVPCRQGVLHRPGHNPPLRSHLRRNIRHPASPGRNGSTGPRDCPMIESPDLHCYSLLEVCCSFYPCACPSSSAPTGPSSVVPIAAACDP